MSIVVTNGCFDLLHAGHLSSLAFARSMGDLLVVALNDDTSVHKLKGLRRPIIPLNERMQLVGALRFVDYVTWFSQDTAEDVILQLRPNVYVKSADYDVSNTIEGKCTLSIGGKVATAPFLPGISTSMIIKKLQGGESQ